MALNFIILKNIKVNLLKNKHLIFLIQKINFIYNKFYF